jgi:putative transcriptional regulator
MTIRHHLDDATLMSFAAGSLPEALAAVAAAHISHCPQCASELRRLERLGGVMLTRGPQAVLTRASPRMPPVEATCVKDRSQSERSPTAKVFDPVERVLDGNSDELPWRRLGIGIWHIPLSLSTDSTGDLRLLKVAPGQTLPDHGHGGAELTLVLEGCYSDKLGEFGRGDVADIDESTDHMPVANGHHGCVCLIASERPAKFRGAVARLLQPFVGM